jgi:transposase-like protein
VVDVALSPRRNLGAAPRFLTSALGAHGEPVEVVTDLAPAPETAIAEIVSDAFHNTDQHADSRVECDHGRLKSRLRPMGGLKTDRTTQVVIAGHAFIQNLRCGHDELGVEAARCNLRVAAAFDELADVI